jgi:uroporphyrinogen decarboxylase
MSEMTSMERVLKTLGQEEPDRVPFFLLCTMHGARVLGLSIRDYFAKAEHVVEGQLRLREKYGSDCIYTFFYAPIEYEAWGGQVVYCDDGPPNSGRPIFQAASDIDVLQPPQVDAAACLDKVLQATVSLKERVADEVPIIGVVMSPFSLPVMQMGFAAYLELLHFDADRFAKLMQHNEDFCVAWANAQLAAGATAICYFDPVASPTVIPHALYRSTGFAVAQRTLARINGPTATHLASGRSLAIIDDLVETGTALVGVSADEDIAAVKAQCSGRLSVLGNLNGIEMRRWRPEQAERAVKDALAGAGPGGGFILADNHGEIPWQVPEEVLAALATAVQRWGQYPLEWATNYDR